MPNATQLSLLDSFFGENGDFFLAIHEDKTFSLGTKLLYLDRAIQEECNRFIRALKLINDLYFNNDVKYSSFGIRKALEHYFIALGPIEACDFKIAIRECIEARKIQIQFDSTSQEIRSQMDRRLFEEETIARLTLWREELDLPQEQMIPQAMIGLLNDDDNLI